MIALKRNMPIRSIEHSGRVVAVIHEGLEASIAFAEILNRGGYYVSDNGPGSVVMRAGKDGRGNAETTALFKTDDSEGDRRDRERFSDGALSRLAQRVADGVENKLPLIVLRWETKDDSE